jgi:hypothetical protein
MKYLVPASLILAFGAHAFYTQYQISNLKSMTAVKAPGVTSSEIYDVGSFIEVAVPQRSEPIAVSSAVIPDISHSQDPSEFAGDVGESLSADPLSVRPNAAILPKSIGEFISADNRMPRQQVLLEARSIGEFIPVDDAAG